MASRRILIDTSIIIDFLRKKKREKNQLIEFRDIFIAATAKSHDFCIATLNTSHFERIEGLTLLELL